MRKSAMVMAAAVLAGTRLLSLNDSRQIWDLGPSRAYGADENVQVSMPKEAFGFNGTLLGKVVKPGAQGSFTIKVVKVIGYSATNKTKLNADALTVIWKDKYDWCAPAKGATPGPRVDAGDVVTLECFQNEMHLRYTRAVKQEQLKPAGDPPAPKK